MGRGKEASLSLPSSLLISFSFLPDEDLTTDRKFVIYFLLQFGIIPCHQKQMHQKELFSRFFFTIVKLSSPQVDGLILADMDVFIYTTSKRIELKSPSCSGFYFLQNLGN